MAVMARVDLVVDMYLSNYDFSPNGIMSNALRPQHSRYLSYSIFTLKGFSVDVWNIPDGQHFVYTKFNKNYIYNGEKTCCYQSLVYILAVIPSRAVYIHMQFCTSNQTTGEPS